jgi:hypothetical protein
MHKTNQPGALASDRAGEFVLGGTVPHTTAIPNQQRHRFAPPRVVSWRVNRWLGVERVEVR